MDEVLPSVSFSVSQWLQIVALGGISGLFGQVIRVVAGLKKASEEAAAKNEDLTDVFNGERLLISLAIGAVAGFLALLTQIDASANVSISTLLALMAAGYAGTDFIEAFAARYLPGGKPTETVSPSQSEAAVSGASAGQSPADDGSVG